MSDKPTKKTKAELLAMLGEAVRNTQPQPPISATQADPTREVQPKLKKARSAAKRTTKAKSARQRKERRR